MDSTVYAQVPRAQHWILLNHSVHGSSVHALTHGHTEWGSHTLLQFSPNLKPVIAKPEIGDRGWIVESTLTISQRTTQLHTILPSSNVCQCASSCRSNYPLWMVKRGVSAASIKYCSTALLNSAYVLTTKYNYT